jgi:predicted small secreted protein
MVADSSEFQSFGVTALVLVCVVLAGCSGFAGSGADADESRVGGNGVDGSDGSEPAANVTPAPVPGTAGTGTPGPRVAPGLATTGVTDASALAAAHGARLANASVTIRRVTTYRYGSGEVARREIRTTRVGPEGGLLRIVEHERPVARAATVRATTARSAGTRTVGAGAVEAANGTEREVERDGRRDVGGRSVVREVSWFGPNRSARAITYANGTTTYRVGPPETRTGSRRAVVASEARRIGTLAAGFETRVRPVGNGRAARYRVTSVEEYEGSGVEGTGVGVGFVPDGGFGMVVDSRGVVHEYRLVRRLGIQRRGKPTEIVTRVRYTDIGETTVSRPPWYDAALEAAGSSSASNRATSTNGGSRTNRTSESAEAGGSNRAAGQ